MVFKQVAVFPVASVAPAGPWQIAYPHDYQTATTDQEIEARFQDMCDRRGKYMCENWFHRAIGILALCCASYLTSFRVDYSNYPLPTSQDYSH